MLSPTRTWTSTVSNIDFMFSNLTSSLFNETLDEDRPHRTNGELVVGTLTFIVITLMTVGGNTLVILSVFTYRPLNKVQNYFLVSLAASDLAVAVLVTPFNVVKFIIGEWVFGLAFCQVWLTCDILCCTASILNLCAIALDRYWAIHDPIEYANKRTLKLVSSMIAVVWILSVLISVPPLIGWNDWSQEKLKITCELTTQKAFVVYSACGSFFIPLIVMTTVYAKIFYAARQRLRSKRRSVRGLSPNSPKTSDMNKKMHKISDLPSPTNIPTEGTMLDLTTTTTVPSSSGDKISPSGVQAEISERSILLKNQQNGNTANASGVWSALRISNSNPSSPKPKLSKQSRSVTVRQFKKVALPSQRSMAFLMSTREYSVRTRGDEDATRTTSGQPLVQKLIKERERISVTKEKKAAKTLAVIMGVFVLCWLPFFTMYLLKPFLIDYWYLHPKVEEAITWLGYINSAINPVIYTIFNLDFRRAFQKYLCPFRPVLANQS